MVVHLYTMSWNEIDMLEFFFRHYDPWVERYVFFDDGSDDGTVEFLRARPNVEVRPLPYSHPDSFVLTAQHLQNHCWKESRGDADWVVVTCVDEHMHHRDIRGYLEGCLEREVTCMPSLGYEMVLEEFPAKGEWLARTRTRGAPNENTCKLRIFDPNAIDEVNYGIGEHVAQLTGQVVLPERDELLMLHYRHMGVDFARRRYNALGPRLRPLDRKYGWGRHYLFSAEQYEEELAGLRGRAVDLADSAYQPWRDFREPKWWRSPKKPR